MSKTTKRVVELHSTMTPYQMALRIVELQDALELAEEAVRANHSPWVGNMESDACHALMTLDEAIDHANEKSIGSSQCAAQHAQLAKWLNDYRTMLATAYAALRGEAAAHERNN